MDLTVTTQCVMHTIKGFQQIDGCNHNDKRRIVGGPHNDFIHLTSTKGFDTTIEILTKTLFNSFVKRFAQYENSNLMTEYIKDLLTHGRYVTPEVIKSVSIQCKHKQHTTNDDVAGMLVNSKADVHLLFSTLTNITHGLRNYTDVMLFKHPMELFV